MGNISSSRSSKRASVATSDMASSNSKSMEGATGMPALVVAPPQGRPCHSSSGSSERSLDSSSVSISSEDESCSIIAGGGGSLLLGSLSQCQEDEVQQCVRSGTVLQVVYEVSTQESLQRRADSRKRRDLYYKNTNRGGRRPRARRGVVCANQSLSLE